MRFASLFGVASSWVSMCVLSAYQPRLHCHCFSFYGVPYSGCLFRSVCVSFYCALVVSFARCSYILAHLILIRQRSEWHFTCISHRTRNSTVVNTHTHTHKWTLRHAHCLFFMFIYSLLWYILFAPYVRWRVEWEYDLPAIRRNAIISTIAWINVKTMIELLIEWIEYTLKIEAMTSS